MMKRTMGIAAVVALALACADDGESANSHSSNNGNNGGANGQNANSGHENSQTYPRGVAPLDTSDFEGAVVWQVASAATVHIDLASNTETLVAETRELTDGEGLDQVQTLGGVGLSDDGVSVATVKRSQSNCPLTFTSLTPPNFGALTVTNVETGELLELPVDIDGSSCRSVSSPTLTADGSQVAFVEDTITTEGESSSRIAIWDGNSDPRTVVQSEDRDFAPTVSGDGSTLIFLSNRDSGSSNEGELFIVPTDGSAEPRKVEIEHPDLDNDFSHGQLDLPVCSDDLSRCMVVEGSEIESRIALLVDTTTGDVTRIGDQLRVSAAGISGDGEKVAYTVLGEDSMSVELYYVDLNDPETTTLIESFSGNALFVVPLMSETGDTIVFGLQPGIGSMQFGEASGGLYEIFVMNADGSNVTLIESDETDDRFFPVGMTFRFE